MRRKILNPIRFVFTPGTSNLVETTLDDLTQIIQCFPFLFSSDKFPLKLELNFRDIHDYPQWGVNYLKFYFRTKSNRETVFSLFKELMNNRIRAVDWNLVKPFEPPFKHTREIFQLGSHTEYCLNILDTVDKYWLEDSVLQKLTSEFNQAV